MRCRTLIARRVGVCAGDQQHPMSAHAGAAVVGAAWWLLRLSRRAVAPAAFAPAARVVPLLLQPLWLVASTMVGFAVPHLVPHTQWLSRALNGSGAHLQRAMMPSPGGGGVKHPQLDVGEEKFSGSDMLGHLVVVCLLVVPAELMRRRLTFSKPFGDGRTAERRPTVDDELHALLNGCLDDRVAVRTQLILEREEVVTIDDLRLFVALPRVEATLTALTATKLVHALNASLTPLSSPRPSPSLSRRRPEPTTRDLSVSLHPDASPTHLEQAEKAGTGTGGPMQAGSLLSPVMTPAWLTEARRVLFPSRAVAATPDETPRDATLDPATLAHTPAVVPMDAQLPAPRTQATPSVGRHARTLAGGSTSRPRTSGSGKESSGPLRPRSLGWSAQTTTAGGEGGARRRVVRGWGSPEYGSWKQVVTPSAKPADRRRPSTILVKGRGTESTQESSTDELLESAVDAYLADVRPQRWTR